jgi:hypothetical protein
MMKHNPMQEIIEYSEHFHDLGEYLEEVTGLYSCLIQHDVAPPYSIVDDDGIAMYQKMAELTLLSDAERNQLIHDLRQRTAPPTALLLELICRLAGELHLSATGFSDFLEAIPDN